ncbi:cadherin-like domain-containing protein, partial [Candidatus Pacearchaeota archaeon]|nr:cadherin-like domain-containing protein [Candidatus Pacearchaeota archaeon]
GDTSISDSGLAQYAFDGTSIQIDLLTVNLDVDDDGNANPYTDGLTIFRYLSGLRGEALVRSINLNGGRTDSDEIAVFLDGGIDTMLDVDDDGNANPYTDGLTIFRYLSGLRGEALIRSINLNGGRTDPDEIAVFLDGFLPINQLAATKVGETQIIMPDPGVDNFEGQIVYLDFDGEQDVTYNGPVVIEGIDIPEFSSSAVGLPGQESAIISQILYAIEQVFQGTGVLFTTTKPESNASFSTIFVGGDGSEFSQYGRFVGLAEKIDIGNQDSNDKAFAFTENILGEYADSSSFAVVLTDLITHETGHLLGYVHDNSNAADIDNYINELAAEFSEAQIITPNPTSIVTSSDSSFTFDVFYDVSDGDNTLDGINVRLHYNSLILTFDSITNLFEMGIEEEFIPQSDSSDLDNDSTTDTFITILFPDLFSRNFPGEALPIQPLFTANFTTSVSFAEQTSINFTGDTSISDSRLWEYDFTGTSVQITPDNYTPVLDNTGDMALTSIDEDNVTNNGNIVSDIIASAGGDRITDSDVGDLEGIAVIGVDDTNGTWQFSINGGTSWTSFGMVSGISAVLLGTGVNDRIRFVPDLNYNGTVDSGIIFRAWDQTDGHGSGATGIDVSINGGTTAYSTVTEIISITVNAVNDAPVASNNAYATDEDAALVIAAPGVLGNDTDVDGDSLTAVLNSGPANGSLTLNADGSFTYIPDADFNGQDSFTYHANDGSLDSNIATVSITVDPV